jgi:eukaryotic-like serine/threonine-protein kinase
VTVAGRLNLFVQVCQAVQHAHQKGIIHRDLKPSNILVCLYDGQPVPKVIDVGLAKAIHHPLTEHTWYTAHRVMVGTPMYMSPEQAELNNLDIDTHTDIFSLGVVLYELLTGTTPLDRQRFKEAAWQEMVRLIKEEEPSKPSTKLSGSGSLPCVAAQRSLEPAQLTRLVRGDLDWIVMKSLEKERSRRYETANGLSRDLQRYLADEVVEARPPSAVYRLRKLVRRNRTAVAAAGLIALALVGGIAGTSWGMMRAVEAQRAEATRAEGERRAKLDAEEQKTQAVAANQQAQKRLAQIEKGNEIITSIFTDLDIRKVKQGNEPLEAVLAARLVKAGSQLEGEAVGDPLVVAGLQERLGLSLMSLGHPQSAMRLFAKSGETRRSPLGADHPDTLMTMNYLANSYGDVGRYSDALKLREETLARRKARLGPDHPDTLTSMSNLANSYDDVGRYADALKLREERLPLQKARLGPDHPDTIASMFNLANSYLMLGRRADSLRLYEQTLALSMARLGPNHPYTLASMHGAAAGYYGVGRYADSLRVCEQALPLAKARLGANHPDTLKLMSEVANNYAALGRHAEAIRLREETLALARAKLGPGDPDTCEYMSNLAINYAAVGRHSDAVKLREETLALRKATLGLDHPHTLNTMKDLAESLVAVHRGTEAVGVIRQAAATWEKLHRTDVASLYNAACFRAAVAATLRAVDTSPTAAKEAGVEADRAMAWLKQAVGAGYKGVANLKKDTDLDLLRSRDDFKKLVAELEDVKKREETRP